GPRRRRPSASRTGAPRLIARWKGGSSTDEGQTSRHSSRAPTPAFPSSKAPERCRERTGHTHATYGDDAKARSPGALGTRSAPVSSFSEKPNVLPAAIRELTQILP